MNKKDLEILKDYLLTYEEVKELVEKAKRDKILNDYIYFIGDNTLKEKNK